MPDVRNEIIDNLQVRGAISGGGIQALARTPVVSMTDASSGSTGILVLDDDDIDFGTGNFSIHWEGALPDYTPTSSIRLWDKLQDANNYIRLFLLSTGILSVESVMASTTIMGAAVRATVATGLTDGANAKITASVIRETASAAGSITYYINGVQLGAAATIAATATTSVSNTAIGYIVGTSSVRYASTTRAFYLYNRALSAAEVASLCINGVPFSDVGASQTITTSWTWANFAGASGYETFTTSGSDITSAINTSGLGIASVAYTLTNRKTFRVRLNITVNSGSVAITSAATTDLSTGSQTIATITSANDGEIYFDFISLIAATRIGFYSASSSNFSVTGFQVNQIGITGMWDAKDAQWDTGQIFDTSGNKNHGMLPAAGATVLPRKTRFEVRGTNTWTGTQELQYIGGVNQAILPANAFIETIAVKVTGTDVHDVFVGDGVDVDRYVVISGGGAGHGSVAMTVGSYTLPIANHTTDGTNLKLTVDPDTNCTMTIAWVISYYTME
jgi:hypothetical protein